MEVRRGLLDPRELQLQAVVGGPPDMGAIFWSSVRPARTLNCRPSSQTFQAGLLDTSEGQRQSKDKKPDL